MFKQIISPSQALLLLMDKYQKDADVLKKFERWYLTGIAREQYDEFKKLCSSLSTDSIEYDVSFSKEVINNDPTRRYFETHLAQSTVQQNIDTINEEKLRQYVEILKESYNKFSVNQEQKDMLERAFIGTFNESDPNLIKEYGNYIARINDGELFSQLESGARDKLVLMAQASLLGVANAWVNSNLPLDIYGTGMYSANKKGKIMKADQDSTRSQQMGLMKGHMAVPQDDITTSNVETPFLKPSDQATYKKGAAWVEHNFDNLVHPYSNSISGTMLCQLRNLAYLNEKGPRYFMNSPEEFADFIKIFIGTMLYGSGGHTLNEFLAPFGISSVAQTFRNVSGGKPFTLERLFLENNERAFNNALDKTREYNNQMLKRAMVQAELKQVAAASSSYNHSMLDEINRLNSIHLVDVIPSSELNKLKQKYQSLMEINEVNEQIIHDTQITIDIELQALLDNNKITQEMYDEQLSQSKIELADRYATREKINEQLERIDTCISKGTDLHGIVIPSNIKTEQLKSLILFCSDRMQNSQDGAEQLFLSGVIQKLEACKNLLDEKGQFDTAMIPFLEHERRYAIPLLGLSQEKTDLIMLLLSQYEQLDQIRQQTYQDQNISIEEKILVSSLCKNLLTETNHTISVLVSSKDDANQILSKHESNVDSIISETKEKAKSMPILSGFKGLVNDICKVVGIKPPFKINDSKIIETKFIPFKDKMSRQAVSKTLLRENKHNDSWQNFLATCLDVDNINPETKFIRQLPLNTQLERSQLISNFNNFDNNDDFKTAVACVLHAICKPANPDVSFAETSAMRQFIERFNSQEITGEVREIIYEITDQEVGTLLSVENFTAKHKEISELTESALERGFLLEVALKDDM